MSHTNSTPNYNLPQFLTSDKPAWLTDVNNAYADIDNGIHAAQVKADNAYSDAGTAQADATLALTNAASADAKASGAIASIEATFDPTTIYSVGAKVMYNSLLYRCVVAVVTPGPWTGSDNWERINVDTLISTTDSKIGNLAGLTTSDKSSCVGAINEVNGIVNGKSNALLVERKTINIKFNNTSYAFTQADVSKPGYICLGIIGYQTSSIGFYFFRANLSSVMASTATIGVTTRQGTNATTTVETFIDVLYVKT